MFSKSWNQYGNLKVLRVEHVSGAFFECIPELGGHMFRLSLHNGHQVYSVMDPMQDADSYLDYYSRSFHGSKLFPFPNRIELGVYHLKNQKYTLEKSPFSGSNAIHGLLSKTAFTHKDSKIPNEISLDSTIESEKHVGYPFSVKCGIRFRLEDNKLSVITSVTNISEIDIPIGDGWHPYFSLNKNIDNLELKLPKNKALKLNQEGIPTGDLFEFDAFKNLQKIGKTRLDHAFRVSKGLESVITIIHDQTNKLKLLIEQETGHQKYNYLQIYTPPDRKSIAIEPMTCAPNAFNNHLGLIMLKRNSTIDLGFSISIQ